MRVLAAQSYPDSCYPVDCSRQVSLSMGFPQAEYWTHGIAPFFSVCRNQTQVSCIGCTFFAHQDYRYSVSILGKKEVVTNQREGNVRHFVNEVVTLFLSLHRQNEGVALFCLGLSLSQSDHVQDLCSVRLSCPEEEWCGLAEVSGSRSEVGAFCFLPQYQTRKTIMAKISAVEMKYIKQNI